MFNFFKKKNIPKKEEQEAHSIKIMYSYDWKDDIPENERDTPEHPCRPFCKKLLELSKDRLFSRQDINAISIRVGYSVWELKGGEDCRHQWVSHFVKK
ncbi:MAG: hypothetical protein KGO92_06860 [Bacteroidota bacterium]|nr:hypothetical protein [Bacteroidota bacterium]